jgi:hypothetical protein
MRVLNSRSEMLHPDDGGGKLLWNVDQYLQDYTVQHPRRQPYLYFVFSPYKPEVLHLS